MLMKVEIPASVYQIMLAHALSTEKVCVLHTLVYIVTGNTNLHHLGRDYRHADR